MKKFQTLYLFFVYFYFSLQTFTQRTDETCLCHARPNSPLPHGHNSRIANLTILERSIFVHYGLVTVGSIIGGKDDWLDYNCACSSCLTTGCANCEWV